MEAIEPGKLARIVRENISQFRDEHLDWKTRVSALDAQGTLDEAFEEACSDEIAEFEAIKDEAEGVYERYRSRLEALRAEMDTDLEPLRLRLENVQQAIRDRLEDLDPALPSLPEPETTPDDEGWLFDSRRDYMEQLKHYRRSKAE